jgi:hypothetical protein
MNNAYTIKIIINGRLPGELPSRFQLGLGRGDRTTKITADPLKVLKLPLKFAMMLCGLLV